MINFFRKKKRPYLTTDFGDDSYLFDFKTNFQGTITVGNMMFEHEGDTLRRKEPEAHTTKISIKPKDVFNELEIVPNPFSMQNLDNKIFMLKQKERLSTQRHSTREIKGTIERLQNRKKYAKHAKFFQQFNNTTDEKIKLLTDKYDLKIDSADIFVPDFPDDAVKTMNEYSDKVFKICGKKPVYYVIARPCDFIKKQEKRDPILLVQSPFGFYWQILGAWDEEMMLLNEL